jgi:hypothetical protein
VTEIITWRESLREEMLSQGDPGPVVDYAPSEAEFDVKFDAGYGGSQGPAVLAWTETRVYFPVVYDGTEWLGSAQSGARWPGSRGRPAMKVDPMWTFDLEPPGARRQGPPPTRTDAPPAGLEPATLRLTAECSAN